MTKQYNLIFDMITEMSGSYGRDRVDRVAVRETEKFYFAQVGNGEIKYPKLAERDADGCVSSRSGSGREMRTSETKLYVIDSPKAQAIRHDHKMRRIAEQVRTEYSAMVKANNQDPRILEIAKILGIHLDS